MNLAEFSELGPVSRTPYVPSFPHSFRFPYNFRSDLEAVHTWACAVSTHLRLPICPSAIRCAHTTVQTKALYLQQKFSNSETGWCQVGTGLNSRSLPKTCQPVQLLCEIAPQSPKPPAVLSRGEVGHPRIESLETDFAMPRPTDPSGRWCLPGGARNARMSHECSDVGHWVPSNLPAQVECRLS